MLLDEVTIQREFGNLLKIPDNHPKYVITMNEMQSGGNHQGIKQISLRDFLLVEDKEKLQVNYPTFTFEHKKRRFSQTSFSKNTLFINILNYSPRFLFKFIIIIRFV